MIFKYNIGSSIEVYPTINKRWKKERVAWVIIFSFFIFKIKDYAYLLRKMIPSLHFLILIMIMSNVAYQKQIGYIYNASYVSNDTTTIIMYNNACSECICYGFFSSVLPLYVGLNCYKNKRCILFTNYSTPSTMAVNLNSTFIFIQQPPSQNIPSIRKDLCIYSYVVRFL